MSGKQDKRRRAAEARKEKLAKRRRLLIVSLSLLVLAAMAVALPVVISRRARMMRINVVNAGGERLPYALFADALRFLDGESETDLGGTIELYSSPGELPPEERDVLITPASYGVPRDRLVAVDPYILTLDRRAGESPLQQPGSSITDLTSWLDSLDTDSWTPFVVAGERREDFAAFILYLSGELLGADRREAVRSELRQTSRAARGERSPTEAMTGDPESLEALMQQLLPVVELLREWKEAEILVFNWTNYDRIALEQAIREGRAAVIFQRRSELDSLLWEETFHLRMRLPPVGPSRRLYSMVGYGISVSPGDGARSDATEVVAFLLRRPAVQDAIESESSWSPLVQEGTPINREHRDVVRWIAGAQEYLVLESAVVDHPLFRRLHQILR